jgi:DsbC/DsbD-like thiol-disulfide interchange protein
MFFRAFFLSGCAAAAIAAAPAQPGQPTVTKHVSVVASVQKTAGGVMLALDVTPLPKMHVYAPGEKDGIPVTLTVVATPAFKAGTVKFPPPQKYYFAPLQLTQLVFSKPFQILQPITPTEPGAPITVTGTFRYQACDDLVCYLPVNVPVKWEVQ